MLGILDVVIFVGWAAQYYNGNLRSPRIGLIAHPIFYHTSIWSYLVMIEYTPQSKIDILWLMIKFMALIGWILRSARVHYTRQDIELYADPNLLVEISLKVVSTAYVAFFIFALQIEAWYYSN
jgi:hypothetical protein